MERERSRRITLTDVVSPLMDSVIASSAEIRKSSSGTSQVTFAILADAEELVARAQSRRPKTGENK